MTEPRNHRFHSRLGPANSGHPLPSEAGGVLIVTLVLCVIIGVVVGSYLSLIGSQQGSVARSLAWNNALVVAEAGIEEAIGHLNSGIATNTLATNSWVSKGGGIYEKTNVVGRSYSVVDIKISPSVTNRDPVIVASARVPG